MIAFYPRDSYLLVDTLHQGYATESERLEEQNTNQYCTYYTLEIRFKLPFLCSRAIPRSLQIQEPVKNLAFLKF